MTVRKKKLIRLSILFILNLVSVIGTGIGLWQHNVGVIFLCSIPQLIRIGYEFAKEQLK